MCVLYKLCRKKINNIAYKRFIKLCYKYSVFSFDVSQLSALYAQFAYILVKRDGAFLTIATHIRAIAALIFKT